MLPVLELKRMKNSKNIRKYFTKINLDPSPLYLDGKTGPALNTSTGTGT
jgi:hypothetical protein